MEERMKRIEEYTKTMRELISKLIEENPDSRSEIYNEMWGPCWNEISALTKNSITSQDIEGTSFL